MDDDLNAFLDAMEQEHNYRPRVLPGGVLMHSRDADRYEGWQIANTRPALLRDAGDGWRDMRDAPFGVDVLVITAGGYQQVAMQCDISHWADRNGHYVRPLMWRPLPHPPAMHAPGGAGGGSNG